jgi:Holliday junction resolvasome RuvABC endonuclease subunit
MITAVGLDLSLTSTGISCGDLIEVIAPKVKGVERLLYIRDAVMEFVLSDYENPLVIVEGYSFGSKNSQAHSIGELGGVVRVALHLERIPFVVVPPTVRAKFATGKGNASKAEVLSSVSARTGIAWSGSGADDMCDAFILEECGRVRLGNPRYEWPALNIGSLIKVDWTPLDNYVKEMC